MTHLEFLFRFYLSDYLSTWGTSCNFRNVVIM